MPLLVSGKVYRKLVDTNASLVRDQTVRLNFHKNTKRSAYATLELHPATTRATKNIG